MEDRAKAWQLSLEGHFKRLRDLGVAHYKCVNAEAEITVEVTFFPPEPNLQLTEPAPPPSETREEQTQRLLDELDGDLFAASEGGDNNA